MLTARARLQVVPWEIEIGLREGQEEVLRREVEMSIAAECKAHIAADEGIDLGRGDRLKCGARLRDPFLERGEAFGGARRVWRKHPPANTLDRPEGMHGG